MRIVLNQDQFVRLIERLRELIQNNEINPSDFDLKIRIRNGKESSLYRP